MRVQRDEIIQTILLKRFRKLDPNRSSRIYCSYRCIETLTGIHVNRQKAFVKKYMLENKARPWQAKQIVSAL